MKFSDTPKKFEFAFHILMILLLMNVGGELWRSKSGFILDPLEGDPLRRTILMIGYLLALVIIPFYPKKTLLILRRSPILYLLILWAILSVLWSGFPAVSFRRVIAIILTTFYALVLYLRFPSQSFLRLLGAAFFVALLSSLLIVIIKPEWGIMGYPFEGNWNGVFGHKNNLGRESVFALMLFGVLWSSSKKPRQRVLWTIAFVLSFITMLGSRSASALVLTLIMISGLIFFLILQRWRKARAVLLTFTIDLGLVIGYFVVENYQNVLNALGRDGTLTGRIPLWEALIPMGLRHPFGYGYEAFWLGVYGPSAEIYSSFRWMPTYAHNGYLDLFLSLGWIGLVMGVILLAMMFIGNFRASVRGSKEKMFWVLLSLFLIIYNFSDSFILRVHSIYWVLIVYSYISLKLPRREHTP